MDNHTPLDQMSSDELLSFLGQFQDSSESEDVASVQAALEIIMQRGGEAPVKDLPDTDQAWKEFQESYHTAEGEGRSLYPMPAAASTKRRHIVLRRFLPVAAALILLLFGGLAIAQAVGIDIIGVMVRWTDDVFRFSAPVAEEPPAWETELLETGVSADLIPTWIPEGFTAGELVVSDLGSMIETCQTFSNEAGEEFFLRIDIYLSQEALSYTQFEKDPEEVETYISGGNTVYFYSNSGNNSALLFKELCVVSVYGDISIGDLKMIFDSIGRL